MQFVTAVWGEGHLTTFLELGLPSLLSPKNIPGLLTRAASSYHIFTLPQDVERINSAPVIQQLSHWISVKIFLIEETFSSPHLMMSHCHRVGIEQGCATESGVVFIPPDCVWADGSMLNMEKIVNQGAAVIHMSGLRVSREPMFQAMEPYKRDLGCLEIGARELIKIGLQNLHPITEDLFFRERSEKLMPANLLWTVQEQGILARCFHLHPLFIKPNRNLMKFKTTIDDDLGLFFNVGEGNHHIVCDSDEIFAFELSALTHKVGANYRKGNIADVAAWAEAGANAYHRSLVKNTIFIHHADIVLERWAPFIQEADTVVESAVHLTSLSIFSLFRKGHINNIRHRFYRWSAIEPVMPQWLGIHAGASFVVSFFLFLLDSYKQFIGLKFFRGFDYVGWGLHLLRHYSRYYLSRIMHRLRYGLHLLRHYSGYYLSRIMHRLRYGLHLLRHYSGYYLSRVMHRLRYGLHVLCHQSQYYLGRIMHHGKYYLGRIVHRLSFYPRHSSNDGNTGGKQ